MWPRPWALPAIGRVEGLDFGASVAERRGMAGLGKMMKQMAKMQKRMAEVQEEMSTQELQVSSGGGAVTVTVSLQPEIKAIRIDKEFLREEVSLVEETLLEAVKEALRLAAERNEAAMQGITAEFQIPGLPKL